MYIELTGTTDFENELKILSGTYPEWDTAMQEKMLLYSDGYKIVSRQVLVAPGATGTDEYNGMCFGVDPTENGGICHFY